MNELKLTSTFKSKLDRLPIKVRNLSRLGADLTTYEGLHVVAVVGTRKPTPYGKMMTEKLTEELTRAGVVIISGLALGIDCIAHQACLKATGRTIAVSPGGLAKIYPATNEPIAREIIDKNGTIISEYAADHRPRRYDFLQRNRIIVALSDLVLIPEAAEQSGSLNTAGNAMKMNIPVCVVPGNVTSPMSSGTNNLLKQGAHVVTETADILKLLNIDTKPNQLTLNLVGDTPEETAVLQKIALGHLDPTELQAETLLSTIEFQSAITMLEVQGRVAQDSLGTWRLK
jgi:DNA processing protein